MKKKQIKANVIQDEEDQIPVDILAKSIVAISDGFKRVTRSGLNERALVCLIHEASGVGKPAIRDVLACIDQLKEKFIRKIK